MHDTLCKMRSPHNALRTAFDWFLISLPTKLNLRVLRACFASFAITLNFALCR